MNWPDKKKISCLGVVLVLALSLGMAKQKKPAPSPPPPVRPNITVPAPEREFRGLWVATTKNIDWPSRANLTSQQQRAELIGILDRAAKLNFNAVILQVRPMCDALYDSKIEPWSEFLTGQMGRPPRPYYDPLAFALAEAHKRGLELHAYFNPYRVRYRTLDSPVSPKHVSRAHPELVRTYGSFLWLDPSDKGTRDYSLSVVMDVVRRYDIDGVHFDDYFYPYPEEDKPMDIIDETNWRRYVAAGGKLSRSDWRRDNVDRFVESVYRSIKAQKPWVKFGISPFGIWQPGYPPQIRGLNAYEKLSADARKWLANGWVDYLAPQLYWPIARKEQSFPVLLNWWNEQNTANRHLWPGISNLQEAGAEITLIRQTKTPGEFLWHSKLVFQNTNGIADNLARRIYCSPALIPAYPWLSSTPPPQPILSGSKGWFRNRLVWKQNGNTAVARWYLQKRVGGRWTAEILAGNITAEQIKTLPEAAAIYAVDRYGNLSQPAVWVGEK